MAEFETPIRDSSIMDGIGAPNHVVDVAQREPGFARDG